MRTGVFRFCIFSFVGIPAFAGAQPDRPWSFPKRLVIHSQDSDREPVLELIQDGPMLSVYADGNLLYSGEGEFSQQGSSQSGSMLVIQAQGFAVGLGLQGSGNGSFGGGGTSNLEGGGGSNSGHPHDDALAIGARVRCPLEAQTYLVNSLVGANPQDPSTIKCPNHPYFGLDEDGIDRWYENHQPVQSQAGGGQLVHTIDTTEYEMICMPMAMRCPLTQAVYNPQELGLNMAAPLAWACPVHASLVIGQGNIEGQFLTFVSGCQQPASTKTDAHEQEPGTKTPKNAKLSKEKTIFLTGGVFLSLPEASAETPPVAQAAEPVSSQGSDLLSSSEPRTDGGGWAEAGFSLGGGDDPSFGGGGSDSNFGREFPRANSRIAEASTSLPSDASVSLQSVVSSAKNDAAPPMTPGQIEFAAEELTTNESGTEILLALVALGVGMGVLLLVSRNVERQPSRMRRILRPVAIASARPTTPIVLAQPRARIARIDWSRYRHLATDIVEDAVFALRVWIQPATAPANRIAGLLDTAPAIAQAEPENPANRVGKREFQETLV